MKCKMSAFCSTLFTDKDVLQSALTSEWAVSTHPDQTASILWTRGKDGYVTWHH